jgi:hypothetical protein
VKGPGCLGDGFVADQCLEGSVCWPGLCVDSSMNVSASSAIMMYVVVVGGGDDVRILEY